MPEPRGGKFAFEQELRVAGAPVEGIEAVRPALLTYGADARPHTRKNLLKSFVEVLKLVGNATNK